MAISALTTAGKILNRVAAEVGLAPVTDPYSSQDASFVQMQYLLNTACEELMQAYPWELLVREHQITTSSSDSGAYDLPSDFGYMLNQTGWERSNNVPLGGPLSAEDWTYLKGRNLAQSTLYASFRIAAGEFNIYPSPPPDALDINFEYITTKWNSDGLTPASFSDEVTNGSDVPQFDRTLITRAVKVKYLESAGFDTTKAQADYNQIFSFLTGTEKGAGIISAGRSSRSFPYLSVLNLPDTGYGM